MTATLPTPYIGPLDIPEAEFARHLHCTDGQIPDGPITVLADQARRWYMANGTPWVTLHYRTVIDQSETETTLDDGRVLSSPTLVSQLREHDVDAVVLAAITAGASLDTEVQRLWAVERPDEAFVLSAYAAAVVEYLRLRNSAELCSWAQAGGNAILPYYSPGYDGWALDDQHTLLDSVTAASPDCPITALESAMLLPQKSTLTIFPISTRPERLRERDHEEPCTRCRLFSCSLRRTPFHAPLIQPSVSGAYTFRDKALKRWADTRLTLADYGDVVNACFHYDGSTCSDGGVPFEIDFHVQLSRSTGNDYQLDDLWCVDASETTGFRQTCAYRENPYGFTEKINTFKPLRHRPLNAVLQWQPARNPAACLCSQSNRNHKWLMVLQTIHYALCNESSQRHRNTDNRIVMTE